MIKKVQLIEAQTVNSKNKPQTAKLPLTKANFFISNQ